MTNRNSITYLVREMNQLENNTKIKRNYYKNYSNRSYNKKISRYQW